MGDVPRHDPRSRVGLSSFEPVFGARVDQRLGDPRKNLLFRDDLGAVLPKLEVRFARAGLAALRGSAFGNPFPKAAIEDRDFRSAEMAKHEPAADGRVSW